MLPDGHPDVIAFRKDRFIMLELKTKTGKLNVRQEMFRSYTSKWGIKIHVVRSVEEALEVTG